MRVTCGKVTPIRHRDVTATRHRLHRSIDPKTTSSMMTPPTVPQSPTATSPLQPASPRGEAANWRTMAKTAVITSAPGKEARRAITASQTPVNEAKGSPARMAPVLLPARLLLHGSKGSASMSTGQSHVLDGVDAPGLMPLHDSEGPSHAAPRIPFCARDPGAPRARSEGPEVSAPTVSWRSSENFGG
jgi:hypothetical protein